MRRNAIRAAYQWARLGLRVSLLWHAGDRQTPCLVRDSYDGLAGEYDAAWTGHMRDLTDAMLARLVIGEQSVCLDLTCGTGYAAGQLCRAGAKHTTGVDAASRMLEIAGRNHPGCQFVCSDVLSYLRTQPAGSVDVITCCWGLGYTRPTQVIRECSRVLRTGGQLAVIDNSLWSLREMIWTSMRAFSMHPDALAHTMRVRFLPSVESLASAIRRAGLKEIWRDSGERRYIVHSGQEAIERLRCTGAAAGFEFAARQDDRDAVYTSFAALLEARYGREIPIVHRYIAAVARKEVA